MLSSMPKLCPCHSGLFYEACCQPLHEGKPAPNAQALMRSRYAAYALNLSSYIIKTTHPDNPAYQPDHKDWAEELHAFSMHTQFIGLEILNFVENENEAFVAFKAILSQKGQDISFTEESRFLKKNNRWLYASGVVSR